MSNVLWLRDVSIVECAMSFCVAAIFIYKRLWGKFSLLFALIALRAVSGSILIPLLFFRKDLGISLPVAYTTYFVTAWISGIAQTLLLIGIIYHVYREAMRPLQGLQRIGNIIFRWVAVVSIAVSIAIAAGPHNTGTSLAGVAAAIAPQIQQGVFVLTLCLLLFVCFAIRPLGLTFRSRIFGVAIGLGVTATTFLAQAAWLATSGAASLLSPIYLVGAVGTLISVSIWGVYFVLPEPERRMILLPTTSPFFTWNRISEALGDEPGYVAIAGFKPQMLAAAELKVLSSATHKAALPPESAQPAEDALSRTALQQRIAVSQ
jgi:cbb3-type cytochrome oxidase subunit 3